MHTYNYLYDFLTLLSIGGVMASLCWFEKARAAKRTKPSA